MSGVLATAVVVVLTVAFGAAVVFCALYHAMTRGAWRRHPIGVHLMVFTGDIALILGVALAGWLFGDYPGRRVLLFLAYVVFAASLVWRVVILVREQRTRSNRG